jgi:large subunit ribosomal protein L13
MNSPPIVTLRGSAMKTYSAKPSEIKKKWLLIDAEGLVLGRLASDVANVLRGKHKATYTPHMDCGDYVVIVNADRIRLTGKKDEQKKYFWHTGYPGGIKEVTAGKVLRGRFPERLIIKAVERMLGEGPLSAKQMTHLFVYAGSQHPHGGQSPAVYDFAAKNRKNKR